MNFDQITLKKKKENLFNYFWILIWISTSEPKLEKGPTFLCFIFAFQLEAENKVVGLMTIYILKYKLLQLVDQIIIRKKNIYWMFTILRH